MLRQESIAVWTAVNLGGLVVTVAGRGMTIWNSTENDAITVKELEKKVLVWCKTPLAPQSVHTSVIVML